MVTIIKNQLLKHLSRYTKNLSPEQISLSALRGEGELADLTLEEDLLTDLLELPGWLRIASASCNRASFRIPWTKLKTVPILLNLDEVHVALEVCSEPRVVPAGAGAVLPGQGKYSYIHKVIDGISVSVNLVQLHFNCDAFTSSVQISRVTVESRTPQWQKGDLRLTRIKSPDTGQLLIFKELEWQSARVEARPRGAAAASLPPLRLLAGSTHTRIVIKKRLSDCSVVGSRLVVQPEPLAWALTDGQLRAALACAAALAEPVKRATAAATRAKAARKMQQVETVREEESQRSGWSGSGERDALARLFARHDVRETSYHLLAPRVDLHLCDDPGLGRSEKPSLAGGGALQVTLLSTQADFFPYHKASDDRRHWRGYREAATPHSQWLAQSLSAFCGALLERLDPRPPPPPPPPPSTPQINPMSDDAPPEELLTNGPGPRTPPAASAQHNATSGGAPRNTPTSTASPTRTRILQQLGKLMTTCLVLRIDDFTVYKVSTGKGSHEPARPLLSAEKATMPGDAGLLHAEFTHFYYPGDVCFPVPSPKLYVQLSPARVNVDTESLVWLGAFLPHVGRALVETSQLAAAAAHAQVYTDVRMEAIMPKMVLEAGAEHVPQQRDRPRELQLCAARVNLTNVREPPLSGTAGTREELAETLAALRRSAPPAGDFPAMDDDIDPLHDKFSLHAHNLDDVERGTAISAELLWRENRSVWCARAEPAWADFHGARASNKPAPLLDATPLTAWVVAEEGLSRVWCVARAGGLACLQLNHYQLLFLLRQLERVSELAGWLAHDAGRRALGEPDGWIVAGVAVPAAEVTLVLPAGAGRDSCRDLDSAPPDTSSLQDLRLGSSETTVAAAFGSDAYPEPPPTALPAALPAAPPAAPPAPGLAAGFAGFTSMRRGLTSLVTSIDSALTRDDSRSDAASTASSDSERYVVVGLADSPDDADTAFREFELGRGGCDGGGGGVEVAAEVVERSSSPSERSLTSSCRRRDQVSTCTWRLQGVHARQQAAGAVSALQLVAASLHVDECSAIPWDEFQSKFSMRARAWPGAAAAADGVPERLGGGEEEAEAAPAQIAVRLVRTELPREPGAEGLAACSELLEARVRGASVTLNMSTALALAEFAEDEVQAPPVPLQVALEEVRLQLVEDRPGRCGGSSPPPLRVALRRLRLARDASGLLTLEPPPSPPPPPPPSHPLSTCPTETLRALDEVSEREARLRRENDELRRRLATLARLADDNRVLRARLEEAATLRECAHAAQQETESLLADKHQLLDTVRALQEQLSGACLTRSKR